MEMEMERRGEERRGEERRGEEHDGESAIERASFSSIMVTRSTVHPAQLVTAYLFQTKENRKQSRTVISCTESTLPHCAVPVPAASRDKVILHFTLGNITQHCQILLHLYINWSVSLSSWVKFLVPCVLG